MNRYCKSIILLLGNMSVNVKEIEMDFVQYKCPCCGAALQFSPETQKLSCKSCGNHYDLETIQQYEREEQSKGEQDLT